MKTCRAFAKRLPDGGADLGRLVVELANVDFPCHPATPLSGSGTALSLEAFSSDGGQARGSFSSNGSNLYVSSLNPDGGAPTAVANGVGGSAFTLGWWSADPAQGVLGTVDVTLGDGGTILGGFAGSYCGAY